MIVGAIAVLVACCRSLGFLSYWFSVALSSNARYLGSLVADVHNVLINGGIYGYPATTDNPQGKLRLLYESAPMAMIMEQAGGAGSTGHGRLLDVLPTRVHERYVYYRCSCDTFVSVGRQICHYHRPVTDSCLTLSIAI